VISRPALGWRVLVQILVWGVAATMLAPFLWMVSTSLKTDAAILTADVSLLPAGWPHRWQWGNYLEAWRTARLGDFYMNSVFVSLSVTALAVTWNALAGFAFARLRFRGRELTFTVVLATMLLPAQVSFIFAYLICAGLGYVDSLIGLIVPAMASAFGIFYMRQATMSVPESLLDAGRIDGFTDFELFWHIVRPSVTPALAALAIFTFMGSWNGFFWPLIMIDSADKFTLPLAVQALASGQYVRSWAVQMAAMTIITVPNIVVFLIFQKQFVKGLSLTGVKG
jgi:multiple sugar transport system permease protein